MSAASGNEPEPQAVVVRRLFASKVRQRPVERPVILSALPHVRWVMAEDGVVVAPHCSRMPIPCAEAAKGSRRSRPRMYL